ncbi:acyl-CoA mutase large subunit family protein [Vulcanisaeta souniana]|uniref:Methylmalonyl-CoA mutase n=1 Tax=Vulcanisaeta souniana JCM 11219 TaxID=1293586 RepID=A0A830E3W8_9CREN|nr:methylmalonyl-CoA mutase family protein [Vulcanisaeta souniana]BDR90947.1 methylmalonyl-CoA mutase [Vulcanisaeta souniana JCM 11219]GGI79555.1 methylmalonyl-CoA mutase [Vulcanisaeta souniana JCM 11219]
MGNTEKIKEKYDEWVREFLLPTLKKIPEWRKFATLFGIDIKPLYTPLDVRDDYLSTLGFPGEYPFTRGIYPSMYRSRLWTFREYSGFGSPEDTNRRYKFLISQGQTGLSVAFDLPTQLGLDPDHELAYPEVGKVGVSIPEVASMSILFDNIDIRKITTSFTINATAAEILAMYITVAESRGIDKAVLDGTIQNDILKEFIARNLYIYPPLHSMRYTTDIIAYTSKNLPKWHPISISGYHFREAGATAVQELAFTLADAIEYTNWVINRWKMNVDDFASGLSFFFAATTNLFEEVAKFRAARRLYARIMRERFGANKSESMKMKFHVQTSGAALTAQQPEVNIIRTTIQALAAVLGGAQSLHVNAYDEALALPTEKSVKLALRVQQVIAYESGVIDSIDPLGGSYYIEWLTDIIEEETMKIIDYVDRLGGMTKAVEIGYPQRAIAESAYQYQRMVEEGKISIIGVNMFREEREPNIELHRVDPVSRERSIRRVREVRENRDREAWERAIRELRRTADGENENVFPYILNAIRARATIGEVSGVLRDVWGEYRPPSIY